MFLFRIHDNEKISERKLRHAARQCALFVEIFVIWKIENIRWLKFVSRWRYRIEKTRHKYCIFCCADGKNHSSGEIWKMIIFDDNVSWKRAKRYMCDCFEDKICCDEHYATFWTPFEFFWRCFRRENWQFVNLYFNCLAKNRGRRKIDAAHAVYTHKTLPAHITRLSN